MVFGDVAFGRLTELEKSDRDPEMTRKQFQELVHFWKGNGVEVVDCDYILDWTLDVLIPGGTGIQFDDYVIQC